MLLLTSFAAGCLCEDASDTATADAYVGVRGTLYAAGSKCGFTCPLGSYGRVRVTDAATGTASEHDTDADGNFEVPLPAGDYHVEAEVDGSDYIDVGMYTVGAQGWRITRVIPESWQPGVLAIHFAASVSEARQQEIVEAYHFQRIPAGEDGAVRVGCGPMTTDVRARLLAEHASEITAVDLHMYECGSYDGETDWPLVAESTSEDGSSGESSGGSHHHHHHHHHHHF